MGLAVAVQAHERAEGAVPEPADQQFPVRRIVRVAAEEAADVGVPPGDAAQGDVEARADLGGQGVEGRQDVPGPQCGAVALTARPGRADQAEGPVVAGFAQAVGDAP
ncbi:hypothetical protein GCM10010234_41880 [Streptomyces hawaiiensis]